jgi:hypothetical protein
LSANTVLGHFPEYLETADVLGSARFSVPADTWNTWSESRRWTENRAFLDEAMRRGRLIVTTAPTAARPMSAYLREVVYLRRRGYSLEVANQLSLI